jgi:CMP-2-keto-3-deoxyoctulosonic acid synthetase
LHGKPLEKIGNKTLIEHAVASALLSKYVGAANICVATDDERIVTRLKSIKPVGLPEWLNVLMTDESLETGTDRCAQAIENSMGWDECPDWLINVQGDMPFNTAPFIDRLIAATQAEPHYDMITPVCVTEFVEEDPENGWFRRRRNQTHIGIYAYKKTALKEFYESRESDFFREREREQRLEQNRAVDMDMYIKTLRATDILPPLEVNTQADLDRIRDIANAATSD